MRNTRQRETIMEVLEEGEHLSIDEVYNRVSKKIKIDLSTVYRNLNSMLKEEKIERIVSDGKIIKYCLKGSHHGHMICLKCHSVKEIPCEMCSVYHEICKKEGFEDKKHDVNIYGYCKDCKEELK